MDAWTHYTRQTPSKTAHHAHLRLLILSCFSNHQVWYCWWRKCGLNTLLTYHTLGKGNTSSKVPLKGDMLVPRRVSPLAVFIIPRWYKIWSQSTNALLLQVNSRLLFWAWEDSWASPSRERSSLRFHHGFSLDSHCSFFSRVIKNFGAILSRCFMCVLHLFDSFCLSLCLLVLLLVCLSVYPSLSLHSHLLSETIPFQAVQPTLVNIPPP